MGGTAVVVTFDPHPTKILRPESFSRLLTSTPHKLRILESLGLRYALVLRFDAALAAMSAGDFLHALAGAGRRLGAVVVGAGWRFGRGREGTVDWIRAEGARRGFRVVEMEPVRVGRAPVSSTRVREAIQRGDFVEAEQCLGRPYAILGTVVRGRGLGRHLGFPTANLAAHNEQFPPDGVYAVQVLLAGQRWRAVANIGWRPTLSSSSERVLEVHIAGWEGELYGHDLEVEFERFLRPERRFPSPAALAAQIARDLEAALRLEKRQSASTLPA